LPGAAPAWLALAGSALAALVDGAPRLVLLLAALVLAGWWWGGARLAALDRSPLAAFVGTSERARVVVTGPARRSRYALRVGAELERFGRVRIHEPVELQLADGRAPEQGQVLDVLAVAAPPKGPDGGFDERTWLRRHGVHVVPRVDGWRVVGRRGGVGGLADALRRWIALGADEGLSQGLRDRFRAAGLYHLLAVSGQNVALVAGGALAVAWLAGIPRLVGELGALAAICAYVLAVGAQPSVVRAGIAGALGSLSWLLARERDRWWFLLVGAAALLAWNPYTLLDA